MQSVGFEPTINESSKKAQGRARAVVQLVQLSGRGRAGWTIMQAALLRHHIARPPTTAPSMASIQASSNAI